MTIEIPDQLISGMVKGIFSVLFAVGAGAFLYALMRKFAETYPFTRLGVVIALVPVTLFNLLSLSNGTPILLFAMLAALSGILIDGVNQLKMPDEFRQQTDPSSTDGEAVIDPVVIAWLQLAKSGLVMLFIFLTILIVFLSSRSWNSAAPTERIVEEDIVLAGEEKAAPPESPILKEEPLCVEVVQTNENADALNRVSTAIEETQVVVAELTGRVISLQKDFTEYRTDCASRVCTTDSSSSCSADPPCTPAERKPAIIHPQELTGTICLDTEFPMKSYLRLIESTLNEEERKQAEKAFLEEIRNTPKTFWILTDSGLLIGEARKGRSFELLEDMEYEVYREEAEELIEFIKQMGKTKK